MRDYISAMRTRLGHVLWLIAGLLTWAAFYLTDKRGTFGGGEGLLFAMLAAPVALLAYIVSGPPWRL